MRSFTHGFPPLMLHLHHVLLPWHRASIPVGPFQKLLMSFNGRTGEHPSGRLEVLLSSPSENLLWMTDDPAFNSLRWISPLIWISPSLASSVVIPKITFLQNPNFPSLFISWANTRGFSWWPFFHFRKSATSFVCLKRIITSPMKSWWAQWRRPYLPYGAIPATSRAGWRASAFRLSHHSFIALAFIYSLLNYFWLLVDKDKWGD